MKPSVEISDGRLLFYAGRKPAFLLLFAETGENDGLGERTLGTLGVGIGDYDGVVGGL